MQLFPPRGTLILVPLVPLTALACGSAHSGTGAAPDAGPDVAQSRPSMDAQSSMDGAESSAPGDATAAEGGGLIIEGQPFSIAGTVAVVQPWPLGCVQSDAGPFGTLCTGETLRVFLVNNGGVTCGYLAAQPTALLGHVPGLLTAEIDFTNVNGPVQPGDYEVLTAGQVAEAGLPAGTSAFVQFNVTSATCDTTSYANGTGKVTLTSLTSTMATGSYALTFPGPANLDGALSATVCNDPGVGSGGGACASP
jgi:hypothetical protein